MNNKVIKRIRFMKDRLFIRTKAMNSMNQVHWGMDLAQRIYTDAPDKGTSIGTLIYYCLPYEMAPVLIRRKYDPYDRRFSNAGIRDWLWHHVVFDYDGNIIAIHNHGEILTSKSGWDKEIKWFSRFRMAQEESN